MASADADNAARADIFFIVRLPDIAMPAPLARRLDRFRYS
jgi:hypothetical protein